MCRRRSDRRVCGPRRCCGLRSRPFIASNSDGRFYGTYGGVGALVRQFTLPLLQQPVVGPNEKTQQVSELSADVPQESGIVSTRDPPPYSPDDVGFPLAPSKEPQEHASWSRRSSESINGPNNFAIIENDIASLEKAMASYGLEDHRCKDPTKVPLEQLLKDVHHAWKAQKICRMDCKEKKIFRAQIKDLKKGAEGRCKRCSTNLFMMLKITLSLFDDENEKV